jgi:hypothetical protein
VGSCGLVWRRACLSQLEETGKGKKQSMQWVPDQLWFKIWLGRKPVSQVASDLSKLHIYSSPNRLWVRACMCWIMVQLVTIMVAVALVNKERKGN